MKVKRYTLIAGVIFFVLVLLMQGIQTIAAAEDAPPPPAFGECPEYDNLKKRSAEIGGKAYNPFTGYISNQFSDTTGAKFGVKKKAYATTEPRADGNEIHGQSYSTRYGWVCWGEECEKNVSSNTRYCPDGANSAGCRVPIGERSGSFAEFDFDNREKICREFEINSTTPWKTSCNADGTRCEFIYKPCDLIPVNKRGGPAPVTPAYCLYPLKGWFKIKALKGDGWTRLNTRISGTAVPKAKRKDDYSIEDPGTFGLFEKWGDKLNCANDAVFRENKKACTRGVVYNPQKKEFYGWAWNPLLKWISFSGSTLYDTRAWRNPFWCTGASCLTVSYNEQSRRSRWSTAYIGVWVKGIGGNLFARKGFDGISPPPGEFNADYLIVTGKYTEGTEVKSGPVVEGSWEARCDDPITRLTCREVARKAFVPGQRTQTQREGVVDAALPVASSRTNRSLMKRSTLGLFNVAALLPPEGAVGTVMNVAGNTVTIIRDEKDIFGENASVIPLGNKIYYYDGDLIVGADDDRAKRVISSALSGGRGNGTIVVRGNIIIKRPLEYDKVTLIKQDIRQLASLSWVALKKKNESVTSPIEDISNNDWKEGGNIVIDSCIPPNDSYEAQHKGGADHVYNGTFTIEEDKDEQGNCREIDHLTNACKKIKKYKNPTDANFINDIFENQQFATVAGSFFAENTLATGLGHGGSADSECKNLKVKYKTSQERTVINEDGSQNIVLDDDTDATARQLYYDVPLEIRGVVVARDILFQRAYRGVNHGSETIINTGRTLVNPPPGSAEFVRSLPLW